MTVRKRITLLIALTGFVTNIIFSIIIFIELVEQPFDILDNELREEALLTIKLKLADKDGYVLNAYQLQDRELHPYWIRIYELNSGKLFYQSDLAGLASVSDKSIKDKAIIKITVPEDQLQNIESVYRVGVFPVSVGTHNFDVQIAKPMGKLNEEIKELGFSIFAGLIFSCIALIIISHFIAGRILKPIGEMQCLAREISEKKLGQRIPVGIENDEFNNLAVTINNMLDRLQNSFNKQRNLLFDTSHELKTPLTAMRLAIDNFCESNAEKVEPEVKENFQQLKEQVLRMDHLVKDLLSLSAMETLVAVDCNPVNLTDIFALLLEDYCLLASSRKIKIKNNINAGLLVQGDKKKLIRVFSNILDNALKYNKDGGYIDINGGLIDENIVITVSNTGPGVNKTESDKVFEQFYRVEQSRAIEYGGSGLGLTIVKRIIELHNGVVSFDSKLGEITTITVKLPVYIS